MPRDQGRSLEQIANRLKQLSETASTSDLNETRASLCLRELASKRLTVQQLQQTGLPGTVNRLRKLLKSEANVKTARSLIKDWRQAVEAAAKEEEEQPKRKKKKTDAEPVSTTAVETKKQLKPVKKLESKSAAAAKATAKATSQSTSAASANSNCTADVPDDFLSLATSDPVRTKCREMLVQALQPPKPAATSTSTATAADTVSKSPRHLAAEIESTVFADFGGVGAGPDSKYKTRMRSLLMNLRDPKNPGLRDCLLSGDLAGADLARMSPEQLASSEMKRLREQLAKDAIRMHQPARAEAGSSLFSCKRCRQKNCSYYQLQTLPGDEPMTTYVLCNECGFRWKFN